MPPHMPSVKDIIFVMKFIMGYDVTLEDKNKATLKNDRFTIDIPKTQLTATRVQSLRNELVPVFADPHVQVNLTGHAIADKIREWLKGCI